MTDVERTAVRVISLRAAQDRRATFATFATFAADTGVSWSFFDARTAIAPPLHYDESNARRVHGRTLTEGERGTYASHVAAWEWLLDSPYRQLIVFEDDVVADWPLISQLGRMDFSAIGIDYMRLFTKIPVRWRRLRSPFLDRYHHLIRITSFALGTQAYLITRPGAQRLLKHAPQVECPIDAYMDKYWKHGVPNLALYPFPVFERFDSSTIGEARFEKRPIPAADRVALFSLRLRERFAMVRNALGLDPGGIERALLRKLP
jgi:glycosyl transferase family 25